MIWTEDEAKKKWCPMVRQLGTLEKFKDGAVVSMGSQNRGYQMGGALDNCMCISSACMMWRKVDQIGIGPNGEKRDRDLDGRTRWVDRGYCGLAGKVQ